MVKRKRKMKKTRMRKKKMTRKKRMKKKMMTKMKKRRKQTTESRQGNLLVNMCFQFSCPNS
jgi:hypothetical protein